MPTLRDRIEGLERDRFVGRTAELDTFLSILLEERDVPALVGVTGAAGVGKTWLLRELGRVAAANGRSVRRLQVGGRDTAAPVGPAAPGVLLVDECDDVPSATADAVRATVEGLDGDVVVVLAGRRPPAHSWPEWEPLVHRMPLRPFTADEADDYLRRRGVLDDRLRASVAAAAGGLPAALAAAVEILERHPVRSLDTVPEWHREVHRLVERLVSHLRQPDLREVLDVGAVAPHVDESLLMRVTGRPGGDAFTRLSRVAFVRPAARGVAVDDGIRRLLADDLHWRDPERHASLRSAVSSYFRSRQRQVPDDERRAVWADRVTLAFGRALGEPCGRGRSPVAAVTAHAAPIGDAFADVAHVLAQRDRGGDAWAPANERSRASLELLCARPGVAVDVARAADGTPVGFSLAVAMCTANVDAFGDGAVRAALDHLRGSGQRLPDDPGDAALCYVSMPCTVDGCTDITTRALVRAALERFLTCDVVLHCTADPRGHALLHRLGFVTLPPTRPAPGVDGGVRAFVLDLGLVGVDEWIELVADGRRVPRTARGRVLESHLLEVLQHWDDDCIAATSPLASLAAHTGDVSTPETATRMLVTGALDTLAATGVGGATAAEVLRCFYLDRRATADALARRLAMSRATLYRTRSRAVGGLGRAVLSVVRQRRDDQCRDT